MARLYQTGFELGPGTGASENPDGLATGTVTRDTSVFASGLASAKLDSTVSNIAAYVTYGANEFTVNTASTTYFLRCKFCFASLPSTNTDIWTCGGAGGGFGIKIVLTTAGNIRLIRGDTGAQVGSDSVTTIAADSLTFYKIELTIVNNGSVQITSAELRINNESVGIMSGTTLSNNGGNSIGLVSNPGASKVCWLDDLVVNDASGSSNTTWAEDSKIILMKPTSDSQIGSWTGGIGGTTNLFNAVDNVPPAGTATETDSTQIESVDTTGDNATDEYRGSCGTYLAAGILQGYRVKAIRSIINTGEDVATGTKTGSFGLQANPAASYTTFTFGNDNGALGTYPTSWAWSLGSITSDPAVDKTTALILAVRKTDSGSRVASVDFLGAYVDYVPVPPHVNHIPYRYN